MEQKSFTTMGNIAVINFPDETKSKDKKKFANEILKKNKAIKTVLEKSGKFKGRLRKMETKLLAGENTREILYRENGCNFRFNIDSTYFSPRLSNERKEISQKIKKNDSVLVMCAGVGPYPIVIAKNSKCKNVYSNELNREANKYAKQNIQLNKLNEKIILIPGDIKKVASKLKNEIKKFDVIVMARPNLKDPFLKEAFILSKKGTQIYYYGFCKIDEIDDTIKMIQDEAKKAKRKIKILNSKIAGEIAPYKIRVRVDFILKN